jgi:hypothetical protein
LGKTSKGLRSAAENAADLSYRNCEARPVHPEKHRAQGFTEPPFTVGKNGRRHREGKIKIRTLETDPSQAQDKRVRPPARTHT